VSETFQTALSRVDLGKYIDQIQDELRRAITDIGPGKTPGEIEAIQARIQDLIRRQSMELAKEIGFHGNQAMVLMLSNSIISTAWVAFSLRREASNLSKSPEDRLAVIEMLDSLSNALADVIQEGDSYADRYAGPGVEDVPREATSRKTVP
jgi:antitoxin component of RelBE/YafQ-DinJ toxin-antitoxin module